jgi:hypothetical protein
MGYLMMRLTLAGGLQGVYIGCSNDPYRGGCRLRTLPPHMHPCWAQSGPTSDSRSSRPKPPSDGVISQHVGQLRGRIEGFCA